MHSFEDHPYPSVVITGGGTGAPKIARGIAGALPEARIVLVQGTADRGGSSKLFRDELNIAAVGDTRNGIAAFADAEEAAIFIHRFGPEATTESVREKGDELFSLTRLKHPELDDAWVAMQLDAADELAEDIVSDGHTLEGHTYGNFELAASAWYTGSISKAIKFGSLIMGLPENRVVLPSTKVTHDLELHDRTHDGNEVVIIGEGVIDEYEIQDPDYAYTVLTPSVPINPEFATEIASADVFVISSGSWDTSIKPTLQVKDLPSALAKMKSGSKVVALANITKEPVRDSMDLATYVQKLEELTNPADEPGRNIDHVLFNNTPDKLPLGVKPIAHDAQNLEHLGRLRIAIGGNIVDEELDKPDPNDTVIRSRVHHNGLAVGEIIRAQVLSPDMDAAVGSLPIVA